MHIATETLAIGRYRYKVINADGSILAITENAGVAQEFYELGEREELKKKEYARIRRNAGSSRPSNTNSV